MPLRSKNLSAINNIPLMHQSNTLSNAKLTTDNWKLIYYLSNMKIYYGWKISQQESINMIDSESQELKKTVVSVIPKSD